VIKPEISCWMNIH